MKTRILQSFAELAGSYGTGLDFFDVFGRDLVEAAALRAGERVLDLACGRGACLFPAHTAIGATGYALGIDLSPSMVELTADELRRREITNAEVRVGDAEHLDLPDESFDVVTCGFGVFLFPDVEAALRESRRVLVPGGRFVASTFADGYLDYPWLPEVLQQLGVMDPTSTSPRRGVSLPMLRADELSEMLSAAGMGDAATGTIRRRFIFADWDAFLLWVRSHGLGLNLRRLDADGLQRFEQECARRLEAHRTPEGYELVKQVEITVARREGS